jgi:pyrophosphate--fructose-6-phosphate 1-phosphotransferase
VTGYITDVIVKRAESGKNYGVILIPEGLIDFIPEVRTYIGFFECNLNTVLALSI